MSDCRKKGDNLFVPKMPSNAELVDNLVTGSPMNGLISSRPFGRYMTGARVTLKINHRIAAFAFQVSWNINTEQDNVNTIDDYMTYEIAPKRVSVNGTLSMFRLPGQGPAKQYIQSNILSFLMHRYVTIEVRDRNTNTLLFKTDNAVITGRQEEMKAGELVTSQLTWRALSWQDDQEPFMPGEPGNDSRNSGIPNLF